ncbi:copine-9 isoform X1 [Solea senegalensis]|uniref:Copine-9 isoform X1 n=1 Tax=Solea senegalensis TaxID=28829 RepID=A0AAV6QLW7_SOLSE|nr:copine-9 isoform X1 [Solea senegalensis]
MDFYLHLPSCTYIKTVTNLLDMDTFSKSDPVVVLYVQGLGTKEWREFGRTEVIDNTLNPDFVRKFVLDYFFEEKQNLRFDVHSLTSHWVHKTGV